MNAPRPFIQMLARISWLLVISLTALPADAADPRPVALDEVLPYGQRPIDYWQPSTDNPVAELQSRLDAKSLELPYVDQFGYLPAVLKELDVPVESQLLRFRSGSPHKTHITSERPRAIYFNDDVAVAWHPGAVLLELAVSDSQKGTLFYTLVNRDTSPLEFHRSSSQACLGCHHRATGDRPSTGVVVPGHLLRAPLGKQAHQYFFDYVKTHAVPIELRWEASYITGLKPDQRHRGNLSTSDDERRFADDPTYHRPVFDLNDDFETSRYPTSTSDAVAHLVYDHQMLGLNLLTRYSYEHQLNVRSEIETLLIRYLLLIDEAPIRDPIQESAYADWYGRRGPRDDQQRSLHQLDLQTRLFRHRISPLLNSRMVRDLPVELKQTLFTRLDHILTGREPFENFTITDADRDATLSVLRATIPEWPQ